MHRATAAHTQLAKEHGGQKETPISYQHRLAVRWQMPSTHLILNSPGDACVTAGTLLLAAWCNHQGCIGHGTVPLPHIHTMGTRDRRPLSWLPPASPPSPSWGCRGPQVHAGELNNFPTSFGEASFSWIRGFRNLLIVVVLMP